MTSPRARASDDLDVFETAARAGWEHRRSKWTTPSWDRLPLATRLVVVSKTKVAIQTYLEAVSA